MVVLVGDIYNGWVNIIVDSLGNIVVVEYGMLGVIFLGFEGYLGLIDK